MFFLFPWIAGIIFLIGAIASLNIVPLAFAAISFLAGFALIKLQKIQNKKEAERKEKERQDLLLMQEDQAKEEEKLAYTEGLAKYEQQISDLAYKMDKGSEVMNTIGTAMGSSAFQEKEKDWAIHGGIASGIAGPIAGAVTAANVMMENADIRRRNAQNQAYAENQKRSFFNMSKMVQEEKKKLFAERRNFIKYYRASFSKNPDELFSYIKISDKKTVTDERTGAVIVQAKWTVPNKSLWIDGALRAKLYSDKKELSGYAYLVFPKEGTSNGSGYLSGICPRPTPAENYNIVIEPVNLWEIVRTYEKKSEEETIIADRKKIINEHERKFKQEKYNYLTDNVAEIDEENYNKAVKLMNAGNFKGAISVFEEIIGYKDSEKKIAECEEAILDGKYNMAIGMIDARNFTDAHTILTSLGDHKDSKELLESINFKYRLACLKSVKPGDSVFFGKYEQDNDETNGMEKIEWIVLDKQDEKILVISKFGLSYEKYNSVSDKITWENCLLRNWLNNDFINTAFTEEEKAQIPTVTVSTNKSARYKTVPGNDTQDRVFVLSSEEANKYFESDNSRICNHTEYSSKQGCPPDKDSSIFSANRCWWWLRTPGNTQDSVAVINSRGTVIEIGYRVEGTGCAIRPAMWINLNF